MTSTYQINIVIAFIWLITACKTEDEKFADQQYEDFKSKIEDDSLNVTAETPAEYVAQFHYELEKKKEAQEWLVTYNNKMNKIHLELKKQTDSIEQEVNKLGGYRLIEIDSKSKCNLFKGYYMLNKKVTDSTNLAFLALYLAKKLFQSRVKDVECSYPLMSQAFLYQPGIKLSYDNVSDFASMCSITPSNYSGDVFVNKELK